MNVKSAYFMDKQAKASDLDKLDSFKLLKLIVFCVGGRVF